MRLLSLRLRFLCRSFDLFRGIKHEENLVGYEDLTLVKHIVNKTLKRREMIQNGSPLDISDSNLPGMLSAHSQSVAVVDFGGGAGTHFDTLSAVFPEIEFDYYLIETPEMVRVATSFRLDEPRLNFLNLNELDRLPSSIDLLVANSSL